MGEGRPVHKGPARRAAFPPLTLGPRLHPSPAAREEGWRGASCVLAGLWLDLGAAKVPGWRWGRRKGHIKEEGGRKKKKGVWDFGALCGNPHCKLQQEPVRAASKSCKEWKLEGRALPPGVAFRLAQPPPLPPSSDPGRSGQGRKDRACPARPDGCRVSCACTRPARAAAPLSPGIMHGPGPLASRPGRNQRARRGRAGRNGPRRTWRVPKARKKAARLWTPADPAGPGDGHRQSGRPGCSLQGVAVHIATSAGTEHRAAGSKGGHCVLL